MNGRDHYEAAERLLGGIDSDQRAAQVHATLALLVAVREIGDQLDMLLRPQVKS